MKLKNNGLNSLIHLQGRTKILLQPNEILDVPQDVANVWVKLPYVEKMEEETKQEKEKPKKTKKQK